MWKIINVAWEKRKKERKIRENECFRKIEISKSPQVGFENESEKISSTTFDVTKA